MKTPFFFSGSSGAPEFLKRLVLAREDLARLRAGHCIAVLDAHVLYVLFLPKYHDTAEKKIAEALIEDDVLRFAVLPESLAEVHSGFNAARRDWVRQSRGIDLVAFTQGGVARRFCRLMEQNPRDWGLIVEVLLQIMQERNGRRCLRALYLLDELKSFSRPLLVLRGFLESGRILRVGDLCELLQEERLDFDHETRAKVYSRLAAVRGIPSSDRIDALVVARVAAFNALAKASGNPDRLVFLSHESMIEHLDGLGVQVRSFTDLSIALARHRGRLSDGEFARIFDATRAAAELRGPDRRHLVEGDEGEVFMTYHHARTRFREELRNVRTVVLGEDLQATGGLDDLYEALTKSCELFFELLEGIATDWSSSAEELIRASEEEFQGLYRQINNVAERPESLQKFAEGVDSLEWSSLWDARGSAEDLDALVDLAAEVSTEDEVERFISFVVDSRFDIGRLVELFRKKLPEIPSERLPVSGELVFRLNDVHRRQALVSNFRMRLQLFEQTLRDQVLSPGPELEFLGTVAGLINACFVRQELRKFLGILNSLEGREKLGGDLETKVEVLVQSRLRTLSSF